MIKIIQADITTLDIDVIVNAANSSLLAGGGVDGAIHRAAGPELQKFNESLGGCNVGDTRLAPGFKLGAKWIIHTVGPVWQGGTQDEARLLESCYVNCLKLASEKKFGEIAFPAISTGIYGYPFEAATIIALTCMKRYEAEFETIIACCFSEKDKVRYRDILNSLFLGS